jgi:hypothetical protein
MFPQICVLWHNTQIKVICQKKYAHRSVSSTFWTERKKPLLQLTAGFTSGIPTFLAISDLTAVCTILCTRPRIDLYIYFILIAIILIL